MDIALLRTFLEVAATGSFVSAADHLFVTPSAVSLRIQRLEDQLGKPLFQRSRAGAELTAAGAEFEHYALSLVRLWEEARQQVALPEGFTESLSIGAQYALWPRLGFRWVDRLRTARPGLSIRCEVGLADRVTRYLVEGTAQVGLLYTPQLRPGLSASPLLEDELILVASWPGAALASLGPDYVFVDWGTEFTAAHATALAELTNPGLTMALGAMASDYLLNRRAAAYLPARTAKRHIDAGELYLVADAPRFPFPIWQVWRDDTDPGLRQEAEALLADVAAGLDAASDAVLQELAGISQDGTVEVLGSGAPLGAANT